MTPETTDPRIACWCDRVKAAGGTGPCEPCQIASLQQRVEELERHDAERLVKQTAAIDAKVRQKVQGEIAELRERVEALTQEKANVERYAQTLITTLDQRLEAAERESNGHLAAWREQDRILQEIAGLVNDEHITDAAGVLREVKVVVQTKEAAEATIAHLREALKVIHTAVRGDEKSECWTIRKWLDERGVFNDDLTGPDRLVEAACVFALAALPSPPVSAPTKDKP